MLAHTLLLPDPEHGIAGEESRETCVFLHGILGQGSNWRSAARKLVGRAEAHWAADLVDLRMHGASRGFSGPHDIAHAAADVVALARTVSPPVTAVLGHSFGGKVALAIAGSRALALEHLVIVDSNPGKTDANVASADTHRVLETLATLPRTFASRADVVAALTAALGAPVAFAQWLAMNYEREPGAEGLTLRLDLEAIGSLMADYHACDFWDAIDPPAPGLAVDFVIGGASDRLSDADRERLLAIESRTDGQLRVHVVAGAGHFVHVDAPAAMDDILTSALTR